MRRTATTWRARLGYSLLIAVVFACGFGYGWRTARRGLFPYPQLCALCESVRSVYTSHDGLDARDVQGRWHHRRHESARPGPVDSETREHGPSTLERRTGEPGSAEGAGVIAVHGESAPKDGLNFLTSGHGPAAALIDMEGRILHGWRRSFWDVWPDADVSVENPNTQFWRCAHILDNGDVLAIYDRLGLIKVDKGSALLWAYPGACHDDLFVCDDGSIYLLEEERRIVPRIHQSRPVTLDFVAVLSPEGELLRRVPLLESFERSPYAPLLERMPGVGDVLHADSIVVLDGKQERLSPAFKKGNILISFRSIETITVLDTEEELIVWALTGRWLTPHGLSILDNDHMLVFNNAANEGTSEVVELDPFTQEVLWSFRGMSGAPFYTEAFGSCQRLPSGNTLITESDNGRALEVTPEGRIVWEFVSPYRLGGDDELIASLLEMVRLPSSFRLDWLEDGR